MFRGIYTLSYRSVRRWVDRILQCQSQALCREFEGGGSMHWKAGVNTVKTLTFEKGEGVHDPPAPIVAPPLTVATDCNDKQYSWRPPSAATRFRAFTVFRA